MPEANELSDHIAMLAAQHKEKELRLYQEKIDVPTLLKTRAGLTEKAILRQRLVPLELI